MADQKYLEIDIMGDAEIARMEPGDILLVKVDALLTKEQRKHIEEDLKERLPEGVRPLVADKAFSFSILRLAP
jgi:hypothetical protein